MSRTAYVLASVLGFAGLLAGVAWAAGTETTPRMFDRSIARVYSGQTSIDVSASNYTSYVNCLTITPDDNNAMYDVQVTFDLDFGDSVQGFAGGYTSETIRFAVARKIHGAWRIDTERQSATVAGTAAGDRSVTLTVGMIGPVEDCRVYVTVSTEQTDVELPYVVYYRAGSAATFTDVDN